MMVTPERWFAGAGIWPGTPSILRRGLHQLNYVDSPQFQRNIQRALNRCMIAKGYLILIVSVLQAIKLRLSGRGLMTMH
jgi:hypothetical protein